MFKRFLLLLLISINCLYAAKRESDSSTQLVFIPLISASSDSGVNLGAAAYLFRLLNQHDVSYLYFNMSTHKDILTSINSQDNRFLDIFSYQVYTSYTNIGYYRYYGPSGITSQDRVSNLTLKTFNLTFTFGLNITDYLNIGAGFVLKDAHSSSGRNISGIEETFFTYPTEYSFYRNTFSFARRIYLRIDTRDNTTAPTEGEFVEFDLDRSDGSIGSELIFTRYIGNANKIIPLAPSFYFVPRFMWESIIGDDLPFYMLSGIGGSSKLRAFSESRFMDKHSILFGTELRYHFLTSQDSWYRFFEIAAFIDAGNIGSSISRFSIDTLQYCFGGGLRLNISPGIIIRFDYATNTKEHFFYIQQGYPF